MTEKDKQRLARYPLWHEQPDMFEAVLCVLFGYDPIGICFDFSPQRKTEYAAEANAILPGLAGVGSLADVRRVIHEEFARWFGVKTEGVARYDYIATDIWHLMRRLVPPSVSQ